MVVQSYNGIKMIWGLGGNDTNSVHMDDSHRRNVDQKIQTQKSSHDYNCIKFQNRQNSSMVKMSKTGFSWVKAVLTR